ncbi:acyltransferase family protein [Prosthecobacter sp.]|uniref:acyltransferase family protein n=1 Tax=Prosthecobacter sp. TaxID=1965333 RepID=UPI00378430E3
MQKERFQLLHLFRALATLLIVLHHVNIMAAKNYGVHLLPNAFDKSDFRVDFLFVLSGFIITWLYADKCGGAGQGGVFLQKRLTRVYPLLFTLTSLKLLFLLLVPAGRLLHETISLKLVLTSYLMLPTDGYPLILGAWIMPFEVCFYVLFAIAISTNARVVFIACLLWTIEIVGFHLGGFAESYSVVPFFMSMRHVQIMGGVVTALWLRQHPSARWTHPLLITSSLLFAIGFTFGEELQETSKLIRRGWWLVTFASLIAGCVLLEKQFSKPLRLWSWLNSLADSSYSIFLTHSPLLLLGLKGLHQIHALSGPLHYLWMLGLAVLATLIGVSCHYWLEKPLIGWLKSAGHRGH